MSRDSDPQTFGIIGAAMRVHRELGHGFLESVYQEALSVELEHLGIPFKKEIELPVYYRNQVLRTTFRADFVCHETIVVELKAQSKTGGAEDAQLMNYLKATGSHRGLLLNFGRPSLYYKRLVWGDAPASPNL